MYRCTLFGIGNVVGEMVVVSFLFLVNYGILV